MDSEREERRTLGDSFKTEQESVQLVRAILSPTDWLWREQKPDIFVDYAIETIRDGEPTGFQFGIQIKGRTKVVNRKGGVRFPAERKPLKYYRDGARLPVFVILADVSLKEAYWIFAQQYLRENAAAANLDNQNTLTLRFDQRDNFRDLPRFHQALENAEKYMRELYPGSPGAAVRQRERELQKLDPSIGVNVSVHRGQELLELHPSEPFSLTFKTEKSEVKEAWGELLREGKLFHAEMELIAPKSVLLSKLMPPGKYVLKFQPDELGGSVQLAWSDGVPHFLQIDGSWQRGSEAARFKGELPRAPLTVELNIQRGATLSEAALQASTPLDFDRWQGQLAANPAWFDEVTSLISTLTSDQSVTVTYFFEGLRLGSGVINARDSETNREIAAMFGWLRRLRTVATGHAPNAILPKLTHLSSDTERHIDALWALTRGDSFSEDISGWAFDFVVNPSPSFPQNWTEIPSTPSSLKIVGASEFDIFGEAVVIPNVENILSRVRLIAIDDNSPGVKRLSFEGDKGAMWFRRRLP